MKLANLALVSVMLLGTVAIGCKKDDATTTPDNSDTLGTTESQLVEDDSEATDTDDDLEAGIDEPLSGATVEEPGNPADGATDDEVLDKARTNPARFFRNGCLTSTRDGMKIKHVFAKCAGLYGMKDFDGTVTTTFAREPGKLTITFEATGVTINGASISGTRVVTFTRDGKVITKERHGSWTGTLASGKPVTHDASFKTTYDSAAKCITRDGSAQTTVGGRSFSRVIDGFKRCGIGRGGCPEAGGKITLSRTKGGDALTLTVEFLGGVRYQVTRPNGKQVTRLLLCRPNADGSLGKD